MTNIRLAKKIAPAFALDAEFSLGSGVTALCGPSEAGKSLILEIIAGLAAADSGRLIVEDAIVYDAAARVCLPPHLRRCAYVPQRCALFPHVSLRRNFQFAAGAGPRLERARRISAISERFGLVKAVSCRACELPPETRLRAEVARALLSAPRLLLLDERGYDAALLAMVAEAFTGPILMVTSDYDLACAAASKLILLERGRLVQEGAPRDVVNRPASAGAARLLGFSNIFEGSIGALDPGRNSSRLEFDGFSLNGLYIPGHFIGDRVSVAVRPEDLRVHTPGGERPANAIPATLRRATPRAHAMRLEFETGILADAPYEVYERRKDNGSWLVELPPQVLRVL